MAGPTISTLNKWAGELKQLVGAPPPSTSRCECRKCVWQITPRATGACACVHTGFDASGGVATSCPA